LSAKSNDAEPAWWETRGAVGGAFGAVFLLTLLAYAGNSFAIVSTRLISDIVLLLFWLTGALGIGLVVLRAMRARRTPRCLHLCVAIALGLGAMSLIVLIVGLSGLLNRWSSLILLGPGTVASIFEVTRAREAANSGFWREKASWGWLIVLLAPLLAIAMVGAMVPPGILWGDEPNGYDVVEYHLQVPREWFEAGRIVPLSHNVFSYFPMNIEMHYLLAMHLRGGPWAGMYLAQLMHIAFIGLTIFAIYALLADRGPIAIVACVFAGAIPWMSLLAPVAYNEGGLLLWGTLAIGLLAKKGDAAHFLLAGVMAGMACGAKLTAIPMILLAAPIALALAKPQAAVVKGVSLYVASGFVALSPWLIRNFASTGNPVFPESTALFGKAHWSDAQVERWQRANHLPAAKYRSLSGRLSEGWNQVLADRRYALSVIVVAVVAAGISWRNPHARYLIILLALQASFWLFFTHLQSRFFVLAIPIAALLLGMIELRQGLAPLAALCAILAATTWFMMDQRIEKFLQPGIVGAEDLMQLTPLADVKLPEDSHLVLVGDARAFFYQIPMSRLSYRTVFDADVKPGQACVDAWRAGAPSDSSVITVIDPGELMRFSRTYWMIPPPPGEVASHERPYVAR